ncbi:MAG TPA: radical SAM protein [Candidatus Acidoferrum sp.]|nr:radical SAM protein [Candidatus Acidoferrum sp.]
MKASRYNHFFEIEGTDFVLGYNAFSGALAEIEKVNHPRVVQLLANPSQAQTKEDREFIECLTAGGFLITEGIDQTAIFKHRAKTYRLKGNILTLTIAPTLACNFSCDYCFESRSTTRMSPQTQDALIRYADQYLVKAEALRICWFGGEPTTCFSLVESLQTRLLELADRHRIDVMPGMIISNGYLLDVAMAENLKRLRIDRAQITIDGPEAVHDRRRKLLNGRGSFGRIIENLERTSGILEINVRINVDRTNIDSAFEVVEILKRRDILSKVKIHFAQVTSSGSTCADIRENCIGDEEFSNTLIQIYDRLFKMGIRQIEYPYIFSGGAFCGALAEGYLVVSPDGHLFKCWEELSTDAANSVGNLFSAAPSEQQKANLDAYLSWDPFTFSECHECNILPICMGGCPVAARKENLRSRGACTPWKYILKELTQLRYFDEIQKASKQ